MSVVVAIKKDGKVFIGADSQATKGGSRISLSNPNNYKIWKVKGVENCIMGAVGLVRDTCFIKVMNDLVREIDVLHDEIDYEYIINRIQPKIIDELLERKSIKQDNPYGSLESKFIFAYKEKLFTIEYGAVIEHDDFVSLGSGECEAIGSLLSTDEQEPRERIIKAIKASATSDIYVDYPIVITNTESTEFEVINEK